MIVIIMISKHTNTRKKLEELPIRLLPVISNVTQIILLSQFKIANNSANQLRFRLER